MTAQSQSQPSSYWQYPAAGRLAQVVTADVNGDGINEFLVATEDGRVDLISSDGFFQWSYAAASPILALDTVNIDGPSQPEREIVLAMRNQLVVLTALGSIIWQSAIEPLAAPVSVLTNGGQEAYQAWLNQYDAIPVSVTSFDFNNDGHEEILVLLQSGQLQLFDGTGNLLWRYAQNNNPLLNTTPKMVVGDLDQDGQQEVLLGLFAPRRGFSRLLLINSDGQIAWDRAVSGRITALSLAAFAQTEPYIAVGTSLGQVILYNKDRQRIWFRTLNRPVTDLTSIQLPDGPALSVGTSVGTVVTYNVEGRRLWVSKLAPDANRPIVALSAAPFAPDDNQPVLSAVIAPIEGSRGSTDVVLLNSSGRPLKTVTDIDSLGLSHLTDINLDTKSELLLVRFASLELLGLGIGASENAQEWEAPLLAAPSSYLVVDLDQDGTDEVLIGTQDGRLHSLGNDGSILWLHNLGGSISFLASLYTSADALPHIVVARDESTPDGEGLKSWLEFKQANGEYVWEKELSEQITSLLVGELDDPIASGNQEIQARPEIIVGTASGKVIVHNMAGEELWTSDIPGVVKHLLVLEDNSTHSTNLVVGTTNEIYEIDGREQVVKRAATYTSPLTGLHRLNQPGNELATTLLALTADGKINGLNWRGILLAHVWPLVINDAPSLSIPASEVVEEAFQERTESFIIATDKSQLMWLHIENNQPRLTWQLTESGEITSLYRSDLDGDGRQDIVVGKRDGKIRIYSQRPERPELSTELNLLSSPFALTALHREAMRESNLLVITENGLVQLFRAQENRPPLLTNPTTDVSQGSYSVSVSVRDLENNDVTIRLDIQDPETLMWQPQGERRLRLNNGNGQTTLSAVDPQAGADGVRYRLYYDDGTHRGYVIPPAGPQPVLSASLGNETVSGLAAFGVIGLITLLFIARQAQSPAARARRFYRRLQQHPDLNLTMLENKYTHVEGSPDFLLSLASQARRANDWFIASLADGLFLLPNRPHAGLSIINSALEERISAVPATDETPVSKGKYHALQRWRIIYKTSQSLLEAPSITELSLLRPQLVQLLTMLEESEEWSPVLEALLPILTNLRDSERVELVEDRLVYLNEAASLLNQTQEQLPEYSLKIEKTVATHIVRRWSGLVSAEIEELRGRAELTVALKTKRLVPNGRTEVAVEIQNTGRAAAENIITLLEENPAYQVHSLPQVIPLLPPGRKRQLSFAIEPEVQDRFRIALTLTYDDRNQRDKTIAFGDMVHLLPPVRDFKPIANPYIPGTPLRRDSTLFYGREELFNFIAENVGHAAKRNILILVGQRRTGKTSALLQLEHHLPADLLPVYIDCQSLGVTPGIPALLYELAWHIADALSSRGLFLDVPELALWQTDATGYFQRQFLPQVKTLLPAEQTLLLVFDEFEAFQNLVDDGILPPTFFTYMRHLMQHSEGLGFIFVGTSRLEEMSADYWSVLFNIALYRKIGYLSESAATRLICEPVAPSLVYDDLALDKILRVTSGHPYFLQLVCYTLVKQANAQHTGYVTISDVNAALDEMLRLGEVHFAYLWQRSNQTERALLTAVAHLMDRDTPFHPEDLIEYLKPYDIHLNPAEVTVALNRLVEREIMREVTEEATTLYELKIGLVGLWVAQNKSLSKLYASNGSARLPITHKAGKHVSE